MTVEIHKRVYDQKLLGSLNLDNEILERIFLSRGITRAEDLNKSLKILPNPKLLKNIAASSYITQSQHVCAFGFEW